MKFDIIRKAKISIKLTVIYAFMFSLILLILNAAVLYGIKHYLYSQANKQVSDVKNIVLNDIESEKENTTLDRQKFINIPTKEDVYVKFIYKDGHVVYIPERYYHNIKSDGSYGKVKHIEQQEKHFVYENLNNIDNNQGITNIQIVKDMDREYDFMKILFAFMAISDFIGIISSIVIGYIISKKMLKPIDTITRAAENISINNLDQRINTTGPEDELKRLASTLNNMINRLQDSFKRQVQFVSDASHELRTPIAVINGYANLLDRWGKDDRKALEKSIYAIKLEAGNMADLIEKLLFLAKGDSNVQRMDRSKFYADKLINEVVEESRIIYKDHNICSKRNDSEVIFGDYKMIKEMIRVFLNNSVKFTPKGGNITVNSIVTKDTLSISVTDTGIGIPKDEIKNIFNRFYIVDKSRSKEKGGTGLGLSIAKWIADKHNASIEVFSKEGNGTTITVIFPIN